MRLPTVYGLRPYLKRPDNNTTVCGLGTSRSVGVDTWKVT